MKTMSSCLISITSRYRPVPRISFRILSSLARLSGLPWYLIAYSIVIKSILMRLKSICFKIAYSAPSTSNEKKIDLKIDRKALHKSRSTDHWPVIRRFYATQVISKGEIQLSCVGNCTDACVREIRIAIVRLQHSEELWICFDQEACTVTVSFEEKSVW